MGDDCKPSLRFDWFDGTLIEDTRPTASSSATNFADEDEEKPLESSQPKYLEKKPIGFKRLLDLSTLKPPILTLEIANRPGFWHLLESELKGDVIVLIVRILANIYNSLQPGEKTKIVTMLKTKFEKSNFLNVLNEHLSGLPHVKTVDKRFNSHLWDDVQSFYFEVYDLCEGIYSFGGNGKDFITNVLSVLEILETSAIGVTEEHKEIFNQSLFENIHNLKLKIQSFVNVGVKEVQIPEQKPECCVGDMNSFKNLSVFPTKMDLLHDNATNIQPNIINGAYPSAEHYLDLQFKLLREDCFGPLREGICKYMENPTKRRFENIRVYPKVRIIRNYVANNKVGHLVDIMWQSRVTGQVDSKKAAYNKQLMFGSLLLFTSDNFETILCGTVLDSSLDLLSEGYIAILFQNPVSKKIFSEPFLMVESEVFFEPYHRVLKVIQNFKEDELPMRQYIVDVQKDTHPPAYLSSDTVYSIQESSTKKELSFSVLNAETWPITSLGLDQSQAEAFQFALTKEFAVIQGPPGTGKTYIGVKIASTLLKNLSLEGTPMLIICYTNHALDQFLEGILSTTTNIIRLGSQSKNVKLEQYTLNSKRSKMKTRYSHLYASKRKELENIYKQMMEIQADIETCDKEILTYNTVKPYFKNDSKSDLKRTNEDPILTWLFNHLEEVYDDSDDESDDWESQADLLDDKLATCFSEEWARKEIDSMYNSIRYVKEVTDDEEQREAMVEKLEDRIKKVRKRMNCFKKYLALSKKDEYIEDFKLESIKTTMTPDEKWKAYFSAVKQIKNNFMVKINNLMDQHAAYTAELEDIGTLIDCEVMKTARVVGATTTTAARRHDLLRKLYSPIVIVEEAAEVMEAHIVASLTQKCQHLILIGDHKQLRPTAAHYKLARDYNLEISLFERMIRNGLHARTLTTQRRMRPNFAELLVPNVYERLDSHPSVHEYEDVRGMAHNLYFCSHDVFEDSEGLEESWSHRNTYEAKWCVALANYMRQMKYNAEDITILATYNGQVSLIKELSKKYNLLRNVKITAVDNYQGEENRIVILSLVRSNRDGKIGFLNAVNRICVALSRAKEGFYMFGNMGVLQSASKMWRCIHEKLVAQNAIGSAMSLRCDEHKNVLEITNSEDLDNCSQKPCERICGRS